MQPAKLFQKFKGCSLNLYFVYLSWATPTPRIFKVPSRNYMLKYIVFLHIKTKKKKLANDCLQAFLNYFFS